MRKETTEYKLEWTLRSIFANASKADRTTEKEYAYFPRHIPHYRNILGVFNDLGQAGYDY
ncbi:MAG: hypothetical protein GY859_34735, partial [Desulfobacterales bacterium]|nr:hypothetical protein [Desulfobacterales bacterium]